MTTTAARATQATTRERLAEQADAVIADLRTTARGLTLPHDVSDDDRRAAMRTLSDGLRGTSVAVLRVAARRLEAKVRSGASGVEVAELVARRVVTVEIDRNVQLRHLDMIVGKGFGEGLAYDARDIDLGVTGVADALIEAGLTYKLADAQAVISRAAAIARQIERERNGG